MSKKFKSGRAGIRSIARLAFILIRTGELHLRDVVEHRLKIALQEPPIGKLIEINLQPRVIWLASRNCFEQVRWTIKRWVGVICIEVGHLLCLMTPPDNSIFNGKEKFLLGSGRNLDGLNGSKTKEVGVSLNSDVRPNIVDVKGKVFRLIDDSYDNRSRTTTYRYVGSEWSSCLQQRRAPLEGCQNQ